MLQSMRDLIKYIRKELTYRGFHGIDYISVEMTTTPMPTPGFRFIIWATFGGVSYKYVHEVLEYELVSLNIPIELYDIYIIEKILHKFEAYLRANLTTQYGGTLECPTTSCD